MKKRFQCVKGHTWEAAASGDLALAAMACPQCGAPAETAPAPRPPPALATTRPESPARPLPATTHLVAGEMPERFGRYVVKKQLGQGGMGAVYLAHDSQLDREVAIKIPRGLANGGPDVLMRFQREARAAATFHHPNLCPVYEVGEQDGVHYLTMPFIHGLSLGKYLEKNGRLPPRQAAILVRKLALAMQEAHAKGVVHRDLKPGNVMLNQRGEPIIMDFGLARRDEALDPRLTQRGEILGTPAYMAPEQGSGDPAAIGTHTDVYSLGVILYELLTGRLPFEGAPAFGMGFAMNQAPLPPTQVRPEIGEHLEAICLKAMRKLPAERYESMQALADDLAAYLKGKAPSTLGPGKKRVAGEGAALPNFSLDADERAFARTLRLPANRGWLVAAAGIALLILVGAVTFALLNAAHRTPKEEVAAGGNVEPPAVVASRPTSPKREPPPRSEPENPPSAPPSKPAPPADAPPAIVNPPPAEERPRPLVRLLNGGDLRGWVLANGQPAPWLVRDDYVECKPGSGNIFTREQFGPDFELHAEFWVPRMANKSGQMRANSGIFLLGRWELQVLDNFGNETELDRCVGSLYGKLAVDGAALRRAVKPPEQWNVFDVTFRSPRVDANGTVTERGEITVVLNGVTLIDRGKVDAPTAGAIDQRVGATGPIVLQDHGCAVRYRNLAIRNLPAGASGPSTPTAMDFVPLFNGRDLSGWSVDNGGLGGSADQWTVVRGEIVATSQSHRTRNYLLTDRSFGDFVLRFEFAVIQKSHGAVALRAIPGERVPYGDGMTFDHPLIKLSSPDRPASDATGASHWLKDGNPHLLPSLPPVVRIDTWHAMEVTLRGTTCMAKLDGIPIVDCALDPNPATYKGMVPGLKRTSGKVGFQINTGTLRYRNVAIKELPPG